MLRVMRRLVWIDIHAAHGVLHQRVLRFVSGMAVMMRMPVVPVAVVFVVHGVLSHLHNTRGRMGGSHGGKVNRKDAGKSKQLAA